MQIDDFNICLINKTTMDQIKVCPELFNTRRVVYKIMLDETIFYCKE